MSRRYNELKRFEVLKRQRVIAFPLADIFLSWQVRKKTFLILLNSYNKIMSDYIEHAFWNLNLKGM